jgi:proteasome lid subunit RPN8/RPN11
MKNYKNQKSIPQVPKIQQKKYPHLPISLKENPKFTISRLAQEKIDELHRLVRYNTEWSGFMLLKTNKVFNNLDMLKGLQVEVEDIILADEGTATYTEADMSSYVEYISENPSKMMQPIGYIHSHNSMSCFFSNTDIEELCINAAHYALYVSLIVNYDGKYVCKGAFLAEVENSKSVKGKNNKLGYNVNSIEEAVVTFDFDIVNLPEAIQVEDRFGILDRLNKIRTAKRFIPKPEFNHNNLTDVFTY